MASGRYLTIFAPFLLLHQKVEEKHIKYRIDYPGISSINMVVVSNIANPTQTEINSQLIYFALGFVSACRLLRKYSLKKRYNPGIVALAKRKSSGI